MDSKVAIDHKVQPEFHDPARKTRFEVVCDPAGARPDSLEEGLTGVVPQFRLEKFFGDMNRATLKDVRQIATGWSDPRLHHRVPPAAIVHHHDSHIEDRPAHAK